MIVLIAANPELDFLYEHRRNKHVYSLDTLKTRKNLGKIPINDPEVIKFLKDSISQWLNDTKSSIL